MKPPGHAQQSSEKIPLTTEEPVRRPWLKTELADINNMRDEACVQPKENTSGKSDYDQLKVSDYENDDSDDDEDNPATDKLLALREVGPTMGERHAISQLDFLWNEMQSHQEKYQGQTMDETSSDFDEADEDLLKRTESNRYIPLSEDEKAAMEPAHGTSVSSIPARHMNGMFTSETVVHTNERVVRSQHYRVREGKSPIRSGTHTPRTYLIAYDFSDESLHALRWTVETMLRNGDTLYVATVLNREDNLELVREMGTSLVDELEATSQSSTSDTKAILSASFLQDIRLITYVLNGRVKDSLKHLIKELDLTMVVCGGRGRNTVKGLLMGSVSTYLVHKSPVPVSIIRPMKSKKKELHKGHPFEAASLSERVRSGNLQVDELSKST